MKKLYTMIILVFILALAIPSLSYAKTKKNYVKKGVPNSAGAFKTYESYKCLTGRNTAQSKLQKKCKTDKKTGIRTYKGRYCVALGSYYTTKIGTKVDLVMKNGKTLKCILADGKDNAHTDSTNRYSIRNKDVVEFVVDYKYLSSNVKFRGDMSYAGKQFRGKVKYIKVYK